MVETEVKKNDAKYCLKSSIKSSKNISKLKKIFIKQTLYYSIIITLLNVNFLL